MPLASCDPAGRGETFLTFTMKINLPNNSGSIEIQVEHDWDGTSTPQTGCDGPVRSVRTINTGNQTAWALMPDKKKPPPYVQLDPGTDVTVTQQGQLNNLGLTKASDVRSVRFTFTNPA